MFVSCPIVELESNVGLFFGIGDRHMADLGCESLPENGIEAVQGVEPDGFILRNAATEVQGQDQPHRSGDYWLVHISNLAY